MKKIAIILSFIAVIMFLSLIFISCSDNTVNNNDDDITQNSFHILMNIIANGRTAVAVCNESGDDLKILTDTTSINEKVVIINPVSSPDGKFIVYYRDDDIERKLIITNPNGDISIEVPNFKPDDEEKPTWSPDSKYFAMNSAVDNSVSIFDNQGELVNTLKLENGELVSDWLSWSPKGDLIALRLYDGHVILVSPDGKTRTNTPIVAKYIFWSDDGDDLIFVDQTEENKLLIKKYQIEEQNLSVVYDKEQSTSFTLGINQYFRNILHIIDQDGVSEIDVNKGIRTRLPLPSNIRFLNYNELTNRFIYISKDGFRMYIYDGNTSKLITTSFQCFSTNWFVY